MSCNSECERPDPPWLDSKRLTSCTSGAQGAKVSMRPMEGSAASAVKPAARRMTASNMSNLRVRVFCKIFWRSSLRRCNMYNLLRIYAWQKKCSVWNNLLLPGHLISQLALSTPARGVWHPKVNDAKSNEDETDFAPISPCLNLGGWETVRSLLKSESHQLITCHLNTLR